MTEKKNMTWEEFEQLRRSNMFRTGVYQSIDIVELKFVGTVSAVDSFMKERVEEVTDAFTILSANLFQRTYETYEELVIRQGMEHPDALTLALEIMHPMIHWEKTGIKFMREIREVLLSRHADEWGMYWTSKEVNETAEELKHRFKGEI